MCCENDCTSKQHWSLCFFESLTQHLNVLTHTVKALKHCESFYPDLRGFFIVRVTHMNLWGPITLWAQHDRWGLLLLSQASSPPSAPNPPKSDPHIHYAVLSQHCIGTHYHKVPRASILPCFINMYWKLFSTLLRQVLLPWRLGPMGVCARVCIVWAVPNTVDLK